MRYIPHSEQEIEQMLETLGAKSLEELFSDIPAEARFKGELKFHDALSEPELKEFCEELASKNRRYRASYLGAGAYRHFIPSAVRAITSRSEFYTAYTPYQAEASQGTLQAIYEFQSFVCLLTGMDVANASLYDGSTSVAEAALLCCNETRRKKILVSRALHPEYREVLRTYLAVCGCFEIQEVPLSGGGTDQARLKEMVDKDTACVIVQNPNFLGAIESGAELSAIARGVGALFVVVINESVSLGLLKAPGAYGADLVVGELQSFGLPLSVGGPYLGFMATLGKYMRKIPGRLCGKTVDKEGKPGFVLTLQAREQHIRREKAASNICTNEALCALTATVFLSIMGKKGLRELAMQNTEKAHYAMKKITALPGFSSKFTAPFFNEFVVQSEIPASMILKALDEKGIAGGLELRRFYSDLDDCLLFCVTEMVTKADIDECAQILSALKVCAQK
jgi:glycine dehydrogenase subunit 1